MVWPYYQFACTLCDGGRCKRARKTYRTCLNDITEWTMNWKTARVREAEDRKKWRTIVKS